MFAWRNRAKIISQATEPAYSRPLKQMIYRIKTYADNITRRSARSHGTCETPYDMNRWMRHSQATALKPLPCQTEPIASKQEPRSPNSQIGHLRAPTSEIKCPRSRTGTSQMKRSCLFVLLHFLGRSFKLWVSVAQKPTGASWLQELPRAKTPKRPGNRHQLHCGLWRLLNTRATSTQKRDRSYQ